jgi:hypothetical protein
LFLAFFGAMTSAAARQWSELKAAPVLQTKLVTDWIVLLFCLALTVSGIMGWNWLRRNGGRLSL